MEEKGGALMRYGKSCVLSSAFLAGIICLTGCQAVSEAVPAAVTASQEESLPVQRESPAKNPAQASAVECLVDPQIPNRAHLTDEERRQLHLSEEFVERVGEFSYESASRILRDTGENGLYSPLSLYFALSMATAGAEGETAGELLKLLNYPDKESLNTDCSDALKVFCRDDELFRFQLASSVWASEQVAWKQPFLKTMEERYYADVYKADFTNPQTGSEMGRWVKEQTKGLIEPTIATTPQTVMALLNTVYYYDQWVNQFDTGKTEEGIFTTADGRKVTCDFMNQTMASHSYYRGEDYTVSALSSKNGSVQFLLPDYGVSLEKFLEDPELLKTALGSDKVVGEVVWQIPKFSYGTSYLLKDALVDLGVKAAFSPEQADFGGMTDSAAWIDTVIQQNHIGIDENGIEAASFTMIAMAGGAMPQGRAEMILDRPFLYVVKHKSCPVFIGICADPASTS